jgi:hypothetical protein
MVGEVCHIEAMVCDRVTRANGDTLPAKVTFLRVRSDWKGISVFLLENTVRADPDA